MKPRLSLAALVVALSGCFTPGQCAALNSTGFGAFIVSGAQAVAAFVQQFIGGALGVNANGHQADLVCGAQSPGSQPSALDPATACTTDAADDPCTACLKRSCCAQALACSAENACTVLVACDTIEASPGEAPCSPELLAWAGPPDDAYAAAQGCRVDHCAEVCP